MATCDACHNSTFGGSSFLPDSARLDQLRHILRSNTVPPEISSFRRVAEEAPVELARYDAEIERLREHTARLLSERATLSWYSDGCRSVAAPVRRLPTELLAQIFDLCAPDGQEVISDTTTPTEEVERLAKKYLLQLAQVCSYWRSVAMETPTLWSLIVLDTNLWDRLPQSSRTLLNLVASSLQRGGECPLTLHIAVDHGDRNERSVLELLSEHSRRWRDVSMWIDPPSFSHLVQAKGNLGRLGFLWLARNTISRNEIHPARNIFQIAPRLSEVSLEQWHEPVPVLPWNQLSLASLRLVGGVPPARTMQILPSLLNSARLFIEPNTLSTPLEPPVLSQINNLAVHLMGESSVEHPILGTLFQSLTLPRLDMFFLVCTGFFPRWEQGAFLDFASRSSLQTTLMLLHIDVVVITDHELLECLATLPLLEELYIADSGDDSDPALLTDHLLQMLIGGSDGSCLVPSLCYLELTSRLTFREDVFYDFIASRVRHRRFEHDFQVVAYWCKSRDYGFSPEFKERLEGLTDEGGFTFRTGPKPDLIL
ncbi:hypothetical protein C8R46DRAFT_1341639 [Mycena filopes]|nr:hypothetical protein C8R46DRAFT_1341639 [Mycena filopes]